MKKQESHSRHFFEAIPISNRECIFERICRARKRSAYRKGKAFLVFAPQMVGFLLLKSLEMQI